MLVANDENGSRCIAWETEKYQAPFHCPECLAEVTLKKGLKKEHHYAHKPPTTCLYGTTESQLHLHTKREIYKILVNHPKCTKVALERKLNGVRPDISLFIDKTAVAIEVQCGTIDIYDIICRTKRYAEFNIYLLWLIPHSEPTTSWREKEYSYVHRIKEWEKFIHAMNFGQLYYWQGGAFVQAYEFKPFEIYVEETEWYGEYGEVRYGGGYTKSAKALRVPVPEDRFHIVDDFKPVKRSLFEMDCYTVPACRLWLSN
jgi:competence protein CoiA